MWTTKVVPIQDPQTGEHKFDVMMGRSWVVLPKSGYYKNDEWDGRMVVSDERRVVLDHSWSHPSPALSRGV